MANGLADRFKRGDESVMDMMKRIKEEITTDATADQWENKTRRIWRGFLVMMKFPKGALYH